MPFTCNRILGLFAFNRQRGSVATKAQEGEKVDEISRSKGFKV
jgi:hypothetical protein